MGKIPYAEGKPINFDRGLIKIKYSELKKVDDGHKAYCNVCEQGLLLLQRDIRTFKLSRIDRCIKCGQAFYYTDETINGEQLV